MGPLAKDVKSIECADKVYPINVGAYGIKWNIVMTKKLIACLWVVAFTCWLFHLGFPK
jgi:hypothetical protein